MGEISRDILKQEWKENHYVSIWYLNYLALRYPSTALQQKETFSIAPAC